MIFYIVGTLILALVLVRVAVLFYIAVSSICSCVFGLLSGLCTACFYLCRKLFACIFGILRCPKTRAKPATTDDDSPSAEEHPTTATDTTATDMTASEQLTVGPQGQVTEGPQEQLVETTASPTTKEDPGPISMSRRALMESRTRRSGSRGRSASPLSFDGGTPPSQRTRRHGLGSDPRPGSLGSYSLDPIRINSVKARCDVILQRISDKTFDANSERSRLALVEIRDFIDAIPCPSPSPHNIEMERNIMSYQTSRSLASGEVSGWARAYSHWNEPRVRVNVEPKQEVDSTPIEYEEHMDEYLKIHIHRWSGSVEHLHEPLKHVGHELFQYYGFMNKFKIPTAVFMEFMREITRGYWETQNTYHNAIHAADVTQTLHCFMQLSEMRNWLSDVEQMAMIFAAIIHDFKHQGYNNKYYVKRQTNMAILYNDISVMENYHLSEAFTLLQKESLNIFKHLTTEQYTYLRSLVIEMVLATDMIKHFAHVKHFQELLKLPDEEISKPKDKDAKPGEGKPKDAKPISITADPNRTEQCWKEIEKHKTEILAFLLHVADISHPSKDFKTHYSWTKKLFVEFFKQGDAEKAEGIPVAYPCDRAVFSIPVNEAQSQIGFIDSILAPALNVSGHLMEVIAYKNSEDLSSDQLEELKKQVRPWRENIAKNREEWVKKKLAAEKKDTLKESSEETVPEVPPLKETPPEKATPLTTELSSEQISVVGDVLDDVFEGPDESVSGFQGAGMLEELEEKDQQEEGANSSILVIDMPGETERLGSHGSQ